MAMGAHDSHTPSIQPPELRGFWRTTASNAGALLHWDLICAAMLTALAVWKISSHTLEVALPGLLTAEFGIIAALLGLVIAGVAIVVGFLGADYAIVLMRSEGGPSAEFWPFWFVSAISALSVVATGAGLLIAAQEPHRDKIVLGVTTFLASYALLASVNLVGFVKAQGETRAYQLALRAERDRSSRSGGTKD